MPPPSHPHTLTQHMYRSFCENYDMQEHSSKIFGDIISAMGGFIQSNLAILSPVVQLPFSQSFGIAASPSVINNSNSSHVISSTSSGERHMHMFSIRSISLQVVPSHLTHTTNHCSEWGGVRGVWVEGWRVGVRCVWYVA